MPVTPTYPGVYIEEVPSGVHTIAGVATSVAAFVDFFTRGPMNKPVQIFSFADFEREFGGLNTLSEASYAIQQLYLNGGSEAWVVRTATALSFLAASVILRDAPGGNDVLQITAGRRIGRDSVDDPGTWGNALRADVDYDTTDPATLFNLTVSEVAVQGGRPVVLRSESYRNLTMAAGASNNAIETVNESSRLVQLSRDPLWPLNRPAQTGTAGNTLAVNPAVADGDTLRVDPGTGQRTVSLSFATAAPYTRQQVRASLEAALRAVDPNDPLYSGAAVQLFDNRLRVLAGRGNGFTPQTLLTFSEVVGGTAAAALGLLGVGSSTNVQQYALGAGAVVVAAQNGQPAGLDGTPPDAAALNGSPALKTGMFALEDVDLFNILCLPRAADLSATEMPAAVAAAEEYCLQRRAFLLVDVPGSVDTVQEAKDWLEQNSTLRSTNAALYFPRTRIADPLNGFRLRSIGASGTMAGLYARTDASRGVWKAPAGTEAALRNVQQLDYRLTDAENGTLNPVAINCLRTFDVYGNVAWGARTLVGADQQASEWKYVPVRRLALFLEESLYRGTQWVVFEPNDEPLWSQIRLNVGAFMHNLFRQGAFQGASPREAYLVKCDRETTTQNDIDLGIVNVVVGFAPLKPAEFLILKIQQLAGQIQT
jgi:Bacteriophage tail sheath protein